MPTQYRFAIQRRSPSRLMNLLLSALVAGQLALVGAPPALAQAAAGGKHAVGKNDDVLGIAKQYKYPNISENQMVLALVQANPNAFELGSARQLKLGYAMDIPPQAVVSSIDAASADKEAARFLKADSLYRAGVAAERKKDMKTAYRSYLTAAHMGHGLAAFRLGQLTDFDPSHQIPHDLQESIVFFQEARKRGIKIDGPIRYEFGLSR
jgi:FimV-like protein